jgi:cytochrome c-type biogenesis protein CcmH/NrfF
MRPHLKGKNWVWWYAPVIPAIAGSIIRRISVHTGLGKK